jgi:hypothetical protein
MADIGQACTIKLDLSVRTIVRSQRLALPQLGYLMLAEAEFGNHLFGLIVEFWRARSHPAWCARQRHRLACAASRRRR